LVGFFSSGTLRILLGDVTAAKADADRMIPGWTS
jgi:hypothetical protein